MPPLTSLFNDLSQQREKFLRWTFFLAVIWIILIDEARERERDHKRRLAAQQALHRQQEEERRKRHRRHPVAKPPTP